MNQEKNTYVEFTSIHETAKLKTIVELLDHWEEAELKDNLK